MDLKVFSGKYLDELVLSAKSSSRLRQHSNIHTTYGDPCQRLFNAIEPGSYIRPHFHGAETLFAIRGLLALITFSDDGAIQQIQRIGVSGYPDSLHVVAGIELPPGKLHTVVSLELGSVLLEIKAGPFDPNKPKHFATWAPEEGSPESVCYLKSLIQALE